MAQHLSDQSVLILHPDPETAFSLKTSGCPFQHWRQASTPAEARKLLKTAPDWILQSPETLSWLTRSPQQDPLTGLLNRQAFLDKADHILQEGEPAASLIVFSLDRFCRINELYGMARGDQLLSAMARRLEQITRRGDLCARLGNDHFALLVRHFRGENQLAALAQRFFNDLSQPLKVAQRFFHPSISMGIASWPADGNTAEQVFNAADAARKQAARQGGSQFVFFQAAFLTDTSRRMQLEEHLHYALERNEIEVWYQPQVHADTGELAGAEALIRWRHPKLGLISPAEFIPVAEETGLIQQISLFALDQVLADAAFLYQHTHPLRFGINLSPRQFLYYDDLLTQITERLTNSPLPLEWIEFEITESQAMTHLEEAIDTMQTLKTLGTQLALDDFGTGYSSLTWLMKFPIDTLKIDQNFVRTLEKDEQMQQLVRAITALGHNLGYRLVAEGVETPWQHAFLQELGVHILQGFLFGQARPASVFIEQHIRMPAKS